jgi:hypothetical protein
MSEWINPKDRVPKQEPVTPLGDASFWRHQFENVAANWQEEHAKVIVLEEKLKLAEKRICYLRATIMDEIEESN